MLKLAARVQRAGLVRRGYQICEVGTSIGRLHVLEAIGGGHHPPMVMLHGLGAAGTLFGPILNRLRPYVRRLIIPDLPGHGFSERPLPGTSQKEMLSALFDTLDDRIEAPAVLFGNSLGGFTALRYAALRPERVRALILVSPAGAPLDPRDLADLRRTLRVEDYREAREFVERLGLGESALRLFIALGVKRHLGAPHIQSFVSDVNPGAFLRTKELSDLKMPILLLWGTEERILPRSVLTFFRRHLPEHAVIEEPEGWGHSPFLPDMEGVVKRVLEFLDEVSLTEDATGATSPAQKDSP